MFLAFLTIEVMSAKQEVATLVSEADDVGEQQVSRFDWICRSTGNFFFSFPLVGVAFVNWFSVLVVTEGITLGWHAECSG